MKTIIRVMEPKDITRVYAIEISAHRAPWTREILRDCVLVGYDCQVIELPTHPFAPMIGYIISRYDKNICHILNLCITPSQQGKGFGKLLLKNFLYSLRKKGISGVTLEVRPSNIGALNLYKKVGFEQVSIKEKYYVDELGEEDAIILIKQLR